MDKVRKGEMPWTKLDALHRMILDNLLKFSHRVAGPLYRCGNLMRQMANGQAVSEFHPRKHDLMREFFQSFNALVKVWNARITPPSTETQSLPVTTEMLAPSTNQRQAVSVS